MLEGLIFILIFIMTVAFAPFAWSLSIPTPFRIIILLTLVILLLSISIMKRNVVKFLTIFVPCSILYFVQWYLSSPQSLPSILYTIAFVLLAFLLLPVMQRYPLLGFLTSRLLLSLAVILAMLAVISFLAYNFSLLPYGLIKLGDFDYYNFYYNPLLGYISPRIYGDVEIGRVAGFMFEPSYMGWYMVTNLLLADNYLPRKSIGNRFIKLLFLAGTIATMSGGALVVLMILLLVSMLYRTLRFFGFRRKNQHRMVGVLMVAMLVGLSFLPKDMLNEALGKSSLEDRDQRIQSSLLLLGSAGPVDILLGKAPGFIENSDLGKGESNQYLKLLVEEGILFTILVISCIVYYTKGSPLFLIATLLFLNSVVILWTPLFIVTLLYCNWSNLAREARSSKLAESHNRISYI